jgi:diguanylate cyclase (GGDEF)-like protein
VTDPTPAPPANPPDLTATPPQPLLRLLLVDDSSADRLLMRAALSRAAGVTYDLYEALDADEALVTAGRYRLDAVLLDYRLPTRDGLACLAELADQQPDVAVLFITGHGDETVAVRALKSGAVDYLIKDQVLRDPVRLDRAVRSAVYTKRLERENQRLMKTLRERNQELERLNRRLWELSHTDGLTGFYNRRFISSRLTEEVARSARYRLPLAVVLVDLDHFKQINDRHGHLAGDVVLQAVAKLFKSSQRDTDLVGRFGGEEFLLILTNTSADGGAVFCERLRQRVAAEVVRLEDGTEVKLTASFGVAGYTFGKETAEDMLRQADQNLYAHPGGAAAAGMSGAGGSALHREAANGHQAPTSAP